MSGWLLVGYGFTAGVLLSVFGLWLPSRAYWRQRLDELRDIRRIEGGYETVEPTGVPLYDAAGALRQAQAAYLPVYPGRRDPHPAWLAFIHEGGRYYHGPRDQLLASEPDPSIHRPRHLTVDDEPTQPLDAPVVLGNWDPPDERFPVWGARGRYHPPRGTSAPFDLGAAAWRPAWGWRERLLAPLALVLAASPRPRRYPWWQKAADRVWEAGVVFEVSGARVNRRILDSLDGVLAALAVWGSGFARVRPAPRRKRVYQFVDGGASWPGIRYASTRSPVTPRTAATPDTNRSHMLASGLRSARPKQPVGR